MTAPRSRPAAGFRRRLGDGGTEILIPSRRFQQEFPDHRAVMVEPRDTGLARTEGGRKPKLTIKAPDNISTSGRIHGVRMSATDEHGLVKPRITHAARGE